MRQSRQVPLRGLLLFISLISSQLCKGCEISKEQYPQLHPLVDTLVKAKYANGAHAANSLLSLRLVGIHSQSLDQQLVQLIRDSVDRQESDLTSGQLALMTLALGACHNPNVSLGYDPRFVGQLERKFQAEIKNMETHQGYPLTNYYQFSTALLALCLFKGNYSVTKVTQLLSPENKNFYFGGQFSVDTGSMAVLALSCMKKSAAQRQTGADLESINNNTQVLVQKILAEKKDDGLLGNKFSTGEAAQALSVASNNHSELGTDWNCQQTLNTLLKEASKGTFNLPIAAAQALPALLGKTYLDVNNDSACVYNSVEFNISTPTVPPTAATSISVHYSVRINETYSTTVAVKNGSVFLDVMEEAQKQNRTLFGFTVAESAWGPYVTSVQGLNASNNDNTYWQLLSEDKPLSQGVGTYLVHDGENLEVRWSKY